MSRILVVEDETHLAMELAWLLQEAGHAVVGPERSVEEARKALARVAVDLALLDVDLDGETVFAISKILEGMGVPFVFIEQPVRIASGGVPDAAVDDQALQADRTIGADPAGPGSEAQRIVSSGISGE